MIIQIRVIFMLIGVFIIGSGVALAQDVGFPLPDTAVIQPENAAQVEQLARIGRGSAVTAAWSPDGKTLAIGGALGLWLYDDYPLLEAEPRLLSGLSRPVNEVAFSRDGAFIFAHTALSNDGIPVWDVRSGVLLTEMTLVNSSGFGDPVYVMQPSPNGDFLATGHSSGSIALWNIDPDIAQLGQLISIFRVDDNPVYDLAWSPDSLRIFSNHDDVEVREWIVSDGSWVGTFTLNENISEDFTVSDFTPLLLKLSPDGQDVAVGERSFEFIEYVDIQNNSFVISQLPSQTGGVSLRNFQTREDTFATSLFESGITALSFSPNGELLAAGSGKGGIKILDRQGEVWTSLPTNELEISVLVFHPDNSQLLSINSDSEIIIWQIQKDGFGHRKLEDGFVDYWKSMAISPDGREIALAGLDLDIRFEDAAALEEIPGPVRVFDLEAGAWGNRLFGPDVITLNLTYSPDGRYIAGVSSGVQVQIIDRTKLYPLAYITHFSMSTTIDNVFRDLIFSPDSRLLATSKHDKTIQFWDVQTGEQFGSSIFVRNTVSDMQFTPDSRLLIVQNNELIDVWDVMTQTRLSWFGTFLSSSLDVSSDGHIIATHGGMWDIFSGSKTGKVPTYSRAFTFSPDSRIIASAVGADIVLSDTCSQEELIQLTGHILSGNNIFSGPPYADILDLAFTPDGRYLISNGADGTVRIWGIPGASEAALADLSVGANCIVTPTPTPSATFTPSATPTITPTPLPSATPTPTFTPTPLPAECASALVPRLIVGEQGRVLDDDPSPINMRNGASTSAEKILEVPAGAFFVVLEGPVCADSIFWYRVDYNGTQGWIAEGVGDYFTEPLSP